MFVSPPSAAVNLPKEFGFFKCSRTLILNGVTAKLPLVSKVLSATNFPMVERFLSNGLCFSFPPTISAIRKNEEVLAKPKDLTVRTGSILRRLAPGAVKLVAPVALSNNVWSALESTIVSVVVNPINLLVSISYLSTIALCLSNLTKFCL